MPISNVLHFSDYFDQNFKPSFGAKGDLWIAKLNTLQFDRPLKIAKFNIREKI